MATEETSARVRFPMWAKLALLTATFAIVPILVVGWLVIDINQETLKTNSREYRLAVAEDVARSIAQVVKESEEGLFGVAQLLGSPNLSPDARVELSQTLVETNDQIAYVSIHGTDGSLIDRIIEKDFEAPAAESELDETLRARAEKSNVAFGEARRVSGGVALPAVVPIRAEGRVTGYVASKISLAPVSERVSFLAEHRFSGINDALFVVDAKRRILARPSGEGLLEEAPSNALLDNLESTGLDKRISQSGEIVRPSGEIALASVKPLDALPWAVVAQVPRDVAYASIARIEKIMLASLGIGAFFAIVLAFGTARRLTRPIKKLMGLSRAIGERDFSARAEVESADELAVLGHTLNEAARELEASEERIRHEIAIRADLGRYLSKDLVDLVVQRKQNMALGGERREITVLFADVVAFTPLVEKHEAEDIVAVLNEFFTILTEIVFRYDGTVDKFIGDSLMAFWGAPRPQEDHAEKALRAAEDMISWLEVGNAKWMQEYGIQIELAIGVNSGEAVVGNIGSETRMEFTAIGQTVNIAARLEALARPGQVLTTSETVKRAGDSFDFLEMGQEPLGSDDSPVDIYEVEL